MNKSNRIIPKGVVKTRKEGRVVANLTLKDRALRRVEHRTKDPYGRLQ